MLEYCLALDLMIPDTHTWRFSDIESFKAQLSNAKSVEQINRVYWLGQAHNVEAYSVMSYWRGVELLKSTVRCLNVGEVVSPSVLTRSVLELACAYLWNANTIESAFRELEFPGNTVVRADEVEAQIVKIIWGTRLGEPEPHVKQTIIEKLAKNPNAKEVLTVWRYLCDIAHPNVVGNTRFWSHIANVDQDGREQRVLARFADSSATGEIFDRVLWGLGWSAAVVRNSFEITQNATKLLLDKLPSDGMHFR